MCNVITVILLLEYYIMYYKLINVTIAIDMTSQFSHICHLSVCYCHVGLICMNFIRQKWKKVFFNVFADKLIAHC